MTEMGFVLMIPLMTLAAVSQAATVKIAFVGNSFTYVNDLPTTLKNVAEGFGHTVVHNQSVIGGCTLYRQTPSNDADTRAMLQNDWDYIVVQDYSTLLTVQRARSIYNHPAVAELASVKKSAKLVLYSTWGYHDGIEKCPGSDTARCFPLGTLDSLTSPNCASSPDYSRKVNTFDCMTYSVARGYFDTFATQPGTDLLAPCGLAWQVARGSTGIPEACKASVDSEYTTPFNLTLPLTIGAHEDTRDVELYIKIGNAYDKHPTVAAQYLNALIFYTLIFDSSPIGAWVPANINITKTQVTGLQQIAEQVVRNYRPHFIK